MSVEFANRGIVRDGLVFSVDPYNRKSYVSGDTTTYNLKRGSNNGTLVNGVTFVNESWGLDGNNQYINFGTVDTEVTDNISIEFWVKADSSQTTPYSDIIDFDHQFGGGSGWVIQQDTSNGLNDFRFYNWTGVGLTSGYEELNFTNLVADEWTNICLTKSGVDYISYTNGVQDSTLTAQSAIIVNSNILHLGALITGGRNFNGDLSQIKIYNKTLTPTEVQQNYKALKHRFI